MKAAPFRRETVVKAPSVVVVSHACVVDVNQEPFRALSARGVPVHVVAPAHLRTDIRGRIDFKALPGVDATPLPVRIGGFRPGIKQAGVHLIVYRGLAALIERLAPDVLYAEEEPWSLTTWQVARIAAERGIPFAFHQSQNVAKRLPPPFEAIRRRVLARAAGATVRLDGPARILRDQGFAGPMLSIPNVVDPSRFEGAQPSHEGLESPVFGFVGRFVAEKGVLDFVRAAAEARARSGRGSALVVGDGPLAAEARKLAATLNLRATFTGPIEHAAIAAAFASMDVLVVPSYATKAWKEQFGRVVIEANAASVAVVATDCGALGDTVRATGGGLVVAERDPAALADALSRLAAQPQERARLALAGKAAVQERFTPAAVAAALEEFFTLLKESR